MGKGKTEAERIRSLWVASNGSMRKKWRQNSGQCFDFAAGDQLTLAQRQSLEDSGMPDFQIDMLRPGIEIMKYFITASNPRWRAVGVEGSDTDIATIHDDLASYAWYISNGKQLLSQVVNDAIVKSKGYINVRVDPDLDRGLGEVVFEYIDSWNIYVDPQSVRIDEEDAAFKIIKVDIPKSQMLLNLPQFKAKINKAQGESDSAAYSQRDSEKSQFILKEDYGDSVEPKEGEEDTILPYYEVYRKEKIPFVNLFISIPPPPKELKQAKEAMNQQIKNYEQELQVQYKEKEQAYGDMVQRGEMLPERMNFELKKMAQEIDVAVEQEAASLYAKARDEVAKTENRIVTQEEYDEIKNNKAIAETIVNAIPFYDYRQKITCVYGDQFLYERYVNCTTYTLKPLSAYHLGNPYPMSFVQPVIGKQQEINKAHQIMIHNANLSSNLRWMYQTGQIEEEYWEKYSSSGGALLPWNDVSGNGQPPIPVQPLPLNNAFYEITNLGKDDIQYMFGVHQSMAGVADKQPEPYRGMLANDEFGTRRIKSWINNVFEPFLESVGKVFMEIAQDTYTAHKVFRIVQPNGAVVEKEMNIPIFDDFGEIIGRFNDYASARFDVRIVAGSTMPVNRWALLDEYFKWLQAGVIDDIAFLAETDIKGKDKIIQRKSLYAQQQQQIAQLEEAIKQEKGTNETLQRQIVQAGIRDKIMVGNIEIQGATEKAKADLSVAKRLVEAEGKRAVTDIQDLVKQKETELVEKDKAEGGD